jgi:hypothetical protein
MGGTSALGWGEGHISCHNEFRMLQDVTVVAYGYASKW